VDPALTLSADARTTAGVLLLTLVAVEWGGLFVARLTRGQQPATPFQVAFSRAGHGHAGILVTLALVTQLLADAAGLSGAVGARARYGGAGGGPPPPAPPGGAAPGGGGGRDGGGRGGGTGGGGV
jgi:hypothetical protein